MSVGRVRTALLVLAAVAGLAWALGAALVMVDGHVKASKFNACARPTQPSGPVPLHVESTETVRLLGDPSSSGLAQWPGLFDSHPTAFDIDGDGIDELIGHSNDTRVYVYSLSAGRTVAALQTCYPIGWRNERVLNSVEAAVLRPGEPASLVVTNPAAYVSVWRFLPAQSGPDRFEFELSWERRMDACYSNSGMDAKPVLSDLDGDGALDILVQTEEVGLYALRPDGRTHWHHCWSGGNSDPVAADLDDDGRMEAIFASDSGLIAVLRGDYGHPLWTFNAADPRYGIWPASVPVSPTVAELDGRAPRELLFAARHAPQDDPARFQDFHLAIFAVHQNPTTYQPELLWMRQPDWAHPLSYTKFRVNDTDSDGSPEIYGMDWNTIGHNPGNWDLLGPAHVFRLTPAGDDVWVREVDSWWSNKEIALVDHDRDGRTDVLVNGARDGADGLWRLSADSGQPLGFWSADPWKLMRGPVLVDPWHDGAVKAAFPVAPNVDSPRYGTIALIDLGRLEFVAGSESA